MNNWKNVLFMAKKKKNNGIQQVKRTDRKQSLLPEQSIQWCLFPSKNVTEGAQLDVS